MNYYTLKLDFYVSDLRRDEFMTKCTQLFRFFLKGITPQNGLIMFFNEILKNIHDHSNGDGSLMLKRSPDFLEFEIEDCSTGNYDLETLSTTGLTTKTNGINRGLGLGMIKDMSEGLNINLNIDSSSGFKYKGRYLIPHPKRK